MLPHRVKRDIAYNILNSDRNIVITLKMAVNAITDNS